jgi:hypothetical protein
VARLMRTHSMPATSPLDASSAGSSNKPTRWAVPPSPRCFREGTVEVRTKGSNGAGVSRPSSGDIARPAMSSPPVRRRTRETTLHSAAPSAPNCSFGSCPAQRQLEAEASGGDGPRTREPLDGRPRTEGSRGSVPLR